ncbi:amidoligase family protein [Kibdelosporangium phytohabitans]|uniref:amidoligase family protein n=1 Tax=Kibdelosporangium phytohabitans TaxID=860235 RepID=UPI0019E4CF3C|nr:amidoligase family protein [Kibdelosporangium phytohabitans]MBE1467475.1 hypothetical protein [Kibdelosporangium phytohabitans]
MDDYDQFYFASNVPRYAHPESSAQRASLALVQDQDAADHDELRLRDERIAGESLPQPVCDECYEPPAFLRTTSENVLCGPCARSLGYRRCQDCGRYDRYPDLDAHGSAYCSNCASSYGSCTACNTLVELGAYYCIDCDDDEDDDEASTRIYGSYYKPEPWFHGNGPLFVGVELEVSIPYGKLEDAAELADDELGSLGYLKEDSSINGQGFEIVSHPMSYGWAIEHFPWNLLDTLNDLGGRADFNGMHVHVSRDAFDGPCHLYRWLKFFYRNRPEVVTLARRESNDWAAFDEYARRSVKSYAKGEKGSRYQAINTQNDATLELRVFAGTLKRQQAQAAIGLAVASVEYTRFLSTRDIARCGGWEWPAFAAWVSERSEFAPLWAEMEELQCAC